MEGSSGLLVPPVAGQESPRAGQESPREQQPLTPAAGLRLHRALSFAGSGFLVTYHLGAAECLLENTPELLETAPRVYGASGGSLIAAAVVCAVNLDHFYQSLKRIARLSRRWFLGPIHPLVNLLQIVRKSLMENLPKNAHELACGRLFISLTRVSDGQNVLVSDFTSNEELVQALLCSCFVPIYCGLIPPAFRGVRYVDGGFTNIQPLDDARNTITISPFAGEMDICPRNAADCFLIWFGKCSFVLSPENLHRVSSALFPPQSKILRRFLWNGYRDALHYLLQNDLLSPDALIVSKVLSSQCCNPHTPSQRGGQDTKQLEQEARFKVGSLQDGLSPHKTQILGVLPAERGPKRGITGTITSLATYSVHSVGALTQRVKGWFPDIPKAFL
ncbi:patatin-like phospholipase domain-containing protein 2 [Chiloscyllium punctatum]|uniref:patatin-like phospholipase domain-containing protein 2 n=1 Tax=Chiloscyllium punctatum TaxID=137246 RepID=UPI003B63FC48